MLTKSSSQKAAKTSSTPLPNVENTPQSIRTEFDYQVLLRRQLFLCLPHPPPIRLPLNRLILLPSIDQKENRERPIINLYSSTYTYAHTFMYVRHMRSILKINSSNYLTEPFNVKELSIIRLSATKPSAILTAGPVVVSSIFFFNRLKSANACQHMPTATLATKATLLAYTSLNFISRLTFHDYDPI